MGEALDDEIGIGYAQTRWPDPRIANEPDGIEVIAVDPSAEMLSQRPPGSAPAIQTSAELR